jgi:hypothetical protein
MSGCGRWSLLLLTLATLPAQAAPEPLVDGVRRCSLEADEHRRLACFDALASALPQIKADQFGMTAQVAHQRDPSVPSTERKDDVLSGTIAELRSGPRGEIIFRLDNGQVWGQAEPDPRLHFSVGEAVQIEHGAMSSLWLAAAQHRKTRVKRMQ